MAFSHSAYSTMGTNLAREVLMAKTMPQLAKQMPQLNKIIKNRKRAKTSAHSQNVNLQVVLPHLTWCCCRRRHRRHRAVPARLACSAGQDSRRCLRLC